MAVLPALRVWPLEAEHAVGGGAVRGAVDPQPQHLVAALQPAFPVEPPVDHGATECGDGAGPSQGLPQRLGVLHTGFDLQLVGGRGPGQAKIASSTAAVSARVAKTCVAPAARSAATS